MASGIFVNIGSPVLNNADLLWIVNTENQTIFLSSWLRDLVASVPL